MNLSEKYRPRQWSDVVGQEKVVASLLELRDRDGLGGNAFWLSGKSGTGKTTIARLIAAEVAEPICITEIDADDLTPATIAEIRQNLQIRLPRAWIINEAHGLTKGRARKLLTLLEPDNGGLPSFVVFVFTTTLQGQQTLFDGVDDAGPLLSRCQPHKLTERNLSQAFAERAREIAVAEGLDGRPLAFYVERVKQNRNNLRAVLQEVQQGRMRP